MDCKDARKLIQEYLDGDTEYSSISAHLEDCAACRAYYKSLLQQKKMLASLSPKNAPTFNLAAAKRRKKSKFNRTLSWASAAAAVFVVVLLTSTMTGIFSDKSEAAAPMEASMAMDTATEGMKVYNGAFVPEAEEAAPVMEEAPAPEEPPEGGWVEDEAPAEEAAVEEAPAEEAAEAEERQLAAGAMINVSQNDFDELLAELSAAGFHPEMTETTFVINITNENSDELNEIFAPYTDKYLGPGLTVYFSAE